MLKLHFSTSVACWRVTGGTHSTTAASGIKETCQIYSSECPQDKRKPIARENSNFVHTVARQELFPGVLIKKTACDVRNGVLSIEGTQVSFTGSFPILALCAKAVWAGGQRGRGWGGAMR